MRAGEAEVAAHQTVDAVARAASERLAQVERPEPHRARVDREHQPIVTAEHIVERADRISDPLGDLAGGEPRIAHRRHLPMPFDDNHFLKLGAAMVGSAGHAAL